jgi:hypothetical protein
MKASKVIVQSDMSFEISFSTTESYSKMVLKDRKRQMKTKIKAMDTG